MPTVSGELELEYAMPIHVPMVDVHTIGAGGGSLAGTSMPAECRMSVRKRRRDTRPICYAAASRPTITDANLVLGRLDPQRLLSVSDAVPLERVRALMEQHVGVPLVGCRRGGGGGCASPTTRWPARSAWCRWGGGTIRATSPCSPSAAPVRCTPALGANWRSAGIDSRAPLPHQRPGVHGGRRAARLRAHRQSRAHRGRRRAHRPVCSPPVETGRATIERERVAVESIEAPVQRRPAVPGQRTS